MNERGCINFLFQNNIITEAEKEKLILRVYAHENNSVVAHELYGEYEEFLKSKLSPATAQKHAFYVHRFIMYLREEEVIKNDVLKGWSIISVNKFLKHYVNDGVTETSLMHIKKSIVNFSEFCVSKGIKVPDCSDLDIKGLASQVETTKIYHYTVIEDIINDKSIIIAGRLLVTLAWLGLKTKELMTLRRSNIDFKTHTIYCDLTDTTYAFDDKVAKLLDDYHDDFFIRVEKDSNRELANPYQHEPGFLFQTARFTKVTYSWFTSITRKIVETHWGDSLSREQFKQTCDEFTVNNIRASRIVYMLYCGKSNQEIFATLNARRLNLVKYYKLISTAYPDYAGNK